MILRPRTVNRRRPLTGLVLLWSYASTWGGAVPTDGEAVVIPAGVTITLDTQTAALSSLSVAGTLIALQSAPSIGITAGNIDIATTGVLQVGSAGAPYLGACTITLTGAEAGLANRFVPVVNSQPAGTGRISRLAVGAGGVASGEVITLTFTSATAFTVLSSTAGALPGGTVGTYYNNRVQFMPQTGSTAWQAGHVVQIGAGTQKGFFNNGVGRSIVVNPGGVLRLAGKYRPRRAILNANASSGATSLTLASDAALTTWEAGDAIVIGPTDFYGNSAVTQQPAGVPEERVLAAPATATGASVTAGLGATRWGALQYATDAGISLTADTYSLGGMRASVDTPQIIDQRARIANLSSNIIVQGANDSTWSTAGFGGHVMVMGLASKVQVDNVLFRRMGQAGRQGRYPIHWHMLSYGGQEGGNMNLPSDGTFLGVCTAGDHYVKNSAFRDCSQRGTVIHGTHGVVVQGNAYYNITGHCIFLEDGAEEGNTIDANTVILVQSPTDANVLVTSDQVKTSVTNADTGQLRGSTGIWWSNPKNTVTNNYAACCESVGLWAAIQTDPLGLCIEVGAGARIDLFDFTAHAGNVGMANRMWGVATGLAHINSRGDLPAGFVKFGQFPNGSSVTHNIVDMQCHKNSLGGYHNNVSQPTYSRFIQSDNNGQGLSGRVNVGFLDDSLMVAASLNNPGAINEAGFWGPQALMASYHFTLQPRRISAFGYDTQSSSVSGFGNTLVGGGFFRTDDLYITPVTLDLAAWGGTLKQFGGGAGWFSPDPRHDGLSWPFVRTWHLSGALYDKPGMWGRPGAYLIRNLPMYTNGAASTQAVPGNPDMLSTATRYIGVSSLQDGNGSSFSNTTSSANAFIREDAAGVEIGREESDAYNNQFVQFKHAALINGGFLRVVYTGRAAPATATFKLTNAYRSDDVCYVAVPLNGAPTACTLSQRGYVVNRASDYQAFMVPVSVPSVASKAALIASATRAYWWDSAAGLVWVKHVGGWSTEGDDSNAYYTGYNKTCAYVIENLP